MAVEYNLSDKPNELRIFQDAINDAALEENHPIASAYEFIRFEHIVDVGCGTSDFLITLLDIYPNLQGTMFDLKITLDLIKSKTNNTFEGRLKSISGDFFEYVPDVGDLYIIKNVIHNWPEKKAIKLLQNIATAMKSYKSNKNKPKDKRLLIIENLIGEKEGGLSANWLDLNFMILVGGAERSLNEYNSLAKKAGFVIDRVLPTSIGRKIIELKLWP